MLALVGSAQSLFLIFFGFALEVPRKIYRQSASLR